MFTMVKKFNKSNERGGGRGGVFCSSLCVSYKNTGLVTIGARCIGDLQDGDSSNGPGEAQADQHQRDRRCGECGRAEEGL